ncbi:hypothetical protein BSZ39_09115 [Bowdeniella nasicola]|uniref:Uncharacterized protein n=1 Tax=Bowdeniella nasicola TaxID=208480 RepID=A0A1Q5Q0W3_9ACTO|nr:hypothetical protein [Bowdeniella nasicola]OKL53501.1 hypothetical protein BSZ39_09115 [Bowdeniella nasicola]
MAAVLRALAHGALSVLDFFVDGVDWPRRRSKALAELQPTTTTVARDELPTLTPESEHVLAFVPGLIAWAKLPEPEPVIVLATRPGISYLGRLVDPLTPYSLPLPSAKRARKLKGRIALDLQEFYSIPVAGVTSAIGQQPYLFFEGKRISKEDFALIAPALGQG